MLNSRKFFRIIFRVLFWLILIAIIISGLFALFIHYKKNEIARKLLDEVNTIIQGEITVEEIHIGRLTEYPDLEVELVRVHAFAYKRADTLVDPFLTVDNLFVSANIDDVLNGDYRLESATLVGGNLEIDQSRTNDLDIAIAFLPIIPYEVDTSLGDTGTFHLAIDTILMLDYEVSISDDRLRPNLDISIDSMRANFLYHKSKIGGFANIWGETDQIGLDSASNISRAPMRLNANYQVNLLSKSVSVKSQELNLFFTPLETEVQYLYGDENELELSLNSVGRSISLKSQSSTDSSDIEFALLEGYVSMDLDVNWKPSRGSGITNQILANLSLEGNDILVEGIDLDNYIDKFKRSQNFNLLDMSALLLAGPAGIAITKGTDYTLLLTASQGDSSVIKHLVADWRVANGRLTATDLAFNTSNNLIAANCDYAIATDSLDMKILVLDKRGCTMVSQELYGTGEEMKSSRVKVIKTLLGPVTNFFRDIGLGNCKSEYSGRVKHPQAKKKKSKKKK